MRTICALVAFWLAAMAPGNAAPSLRPATPIDRGLYVLAGSLHDHSTDSDGNTADTAIAQWLFLHRGELGIDYAGLSDHSDFFPFAASSPTTLLPWLRQAALAQQYTAAGFSWLRAFEYTDDQENHLNVLGSQNWVSAVESHAGLTPGMPFFYRWLATAPTTDPTGNGLGVGGADGVAEFNHPSSKGALNWDDYRLDPTAAPLMATIEIHGDQGRNGLGNSDAGWYWFALAQGWTVSPVMNWDQHDWASVMAPPSPGATCGVSGYLPCQRSLVIASAPTPQAILAAIRARRTSASEIPDLWAVLRTTRGALQGSTVAARPGSLLGLFIDAGATSVALTSVDIYSDNGVSPFPYYYGDNAGCTDAFSFEENPACKPENYYQSQLTPSYLAQHAKYLASGGHATKKAAIDAPPPGTLVASVPFRGGRFAGAFVTVRVPTVPSTRPDGKHFFYAVAHAGAARVWTAPIFTQ